MDQGLVEVCFGCVQWDDDITDVFILNVCFRKTHQA